MFIEQLRTTLNTHSNSVDAAHMQDYMRGQFKFYGIKANQRRALLKEVTNAHKEELQENIRHIALALFAYPERELHLCGMELLEKQLRRSYLRTDIALIEKLITTNSWWDTVDFIAKQILGKYLMSFPDMVGPTIDRFTNTDHLWLNRSTIIFQLGYKVNTNEMLLFKQCDHFKDSDEFFIQKAIGWALREYGKTSPESVLNFVNSTNLKPLSRREAIRNII